MAIAYAAHKAASPIRFPPTVALTPLTAKVCVPVPPPHFRTLLSTFTWSLIRQRASPQYDSIHRRRTSYSMPHQGAMLIMPHQCAM